jgi:hypothetical protein
MATKSNSKAKTATPKVPPVVYVEIDHTDNSPVFVSQDLKDAEDERSSDNRLARYAFVSFMEVKFRAVVTDVEV